MGWTGWKVWKVWRVWDVRNRQNDQEEDSRDDEEHDRDPARAMGAMSFHGAALRKPRARPLQFDGPARLELPCRSCV